MDDKEKKIRRESTLMLKLLGLNPKKKDGDDLNELLIRRTVDKIAFMEIEIQDLQKKLSAEGWEDSYQNGEKQSGMKQNPTAKTYLDLQMAYNRKVKMLIQLAKESGTRTDDLEAFLNG